MINFLVCLEFALLLVIKMVCLYLNHKLLVLCAFYNHHIINTISCVFGTHIAMSKSAWDLGVSKPPSSHVLTISETCWTLIYQVRRVFTLPSSYFVDLQCTYWKTLNRTQKKTLNRTQKTRKLAVQTRPKPELGCMTRTLYPCFLSIFHLSSSQ